MNRLNGTKILEVPERVVDSMVRVYQVVEEFQGEFEDFALSMDEKFIGKMRKARKEHKSGKVRSLAELKSEL